jgi:hypothetical protein
LIERTLRRHFEPLFDQRFDDILGGHYPHGISFTINGRPVQRAGSSGGQVAPVSVRLGRKRRPSAYGYLVRHASALPDESRGVAVSTLGKVIKRGWDWLGVTPQAPEVVGGLVEAPALAACLTLNKADFLRSGPRGAVYLAYRKAMQQAVAQQLTIWGGERDTMEPARRRAARPVERDVESVLLDLATEFPMLAMLVERRSGGQRKLLMGQPDGTDADQRQLLLSEDRGAEAVVQEVAAPPDEPAVPAPTTAESNGDEVEPPSESTDSREAERSETSQSSPLELPARRGRRRPTRLGLTIQFESREDDPELGRLVETTVWVNTAHPAYQRAVASRAEPYHLALSVAMALAGVAVEPAQEHAFVAAFLARWGESATGRKDGARRRRR